MVGFEHHADTLGLELLLHPFGDLHRQPFLELKVACGQLNDSRRFREPDDPSPGQVSDVDAVKGQQVTHAQRVERGRADELS